jgi:hypothetical protein
LEERIVGPPGAEAMVAIMLDAEHDFTMWAGIAPLDDPDADAEWIRLSPLPEPVEP